MKKSTKKSTDLLAKLGIVNFTTRHLQIVDDFLDGDKKDPKTFLNKLGSWDNDDLKIVEQFIKDDF